MYFVQSIKKWWKKHFLVYLLLLLSLYDFPFQNEIFKQQCVEVVPEARS